MKNLLKVFLLALMAVFVLNISYVYAEEQESENIEGKAEEVLEPVVSDIVNLSDDKSDNEKDEVASKAAEASNETTEEAESETEEPVKAEETPKTEEPAKEETPNSTKSVENPELTVKLYDLRISSTEPFKVLTYNSSSAGTTSTKSLGLKDLGVSGIGKNTDNSFKADGYIYTFEGWYTAASGGDKLTTTGITNGNSAVKYIASSDKTRPNGLKVTIGNFTEDITFEVYLNWDKEKLASGKTHVKVTDTRTNTSTTITAQANEGQNSKALDSMVEGISSDYKIETATAIYTFKGFYTAATGGSKIDANFAPGEAYPALKTLRSNDDIASSPSNYKLFVEALDTFDDETTYEFFIQWDIEEKEVPDYTVTVNIVDKRTGKTTTINAKSGAEGAKTLSSMSTGIGDDFKVSDGATTYTFKGFYTEENDGTKIDKDFVPGTNYPEFIILNTNSDATTPAEYKFNYKIADVLESDKEYTFYIQWDEKTKHSVRVTFEVIEQSVSGREVHSGNSLPSYSNTISPNGSWTRSSSALTIRKFHSGDYTYTVDTWYYEDGTPVPEELYVNGDPTRVKFTYVWSEDDPEELTVTYILKWNEKKDNTYTIDIHDEISNGSGSANHWDNTTGHEGSYAKTFHAPVEVDHYEFLYFEHEATGDQYKVGDKYSIDIAALGDGVTYADHFYAWWKADITLILYSDDNELGSKSQFDSIRPSDILENEPEKIGYRFLGWEDAEGNLYKSTDEFFANDPAKKPEPKTVELYAKWEQIKVEVSVSKEWTDNDDNDHIRPDSVTVNLIDKKTGETVDSVVLSDENKWTWTFSAPQYNGKVECDYTVEEEAVEGYEPVVKETSKYNFTIENVHENDKIEILVTKVWDDEYDADSLRPDSVTVRLLVDGDEVDYAILNEENDWSWTFTVDKNAGGSAIEYSVTEDEVDAYTMSVTGSAEKGYFEITNFHEAGDQGQGDDGTDVIPEDEELPPQTGVESNIFEFITLLALVILLIIKK